MNQTEMYGPDEDGFFDIQCKCGSTDFVAQGNEDDSTIRLICFECKREFAFQVEAYLEDLLNNGFNNNSELVNENE